MIDEGPRWNIDKDYETRTMKQGQQGDGEGWMGLVVIFCCWRELGNSHFFSCVIENTWFDSMLCSYLYIMMTLFIII